MWGLIDDEEPPSPEHREFSWPKLIAALVLEGAIFRLVKGLADHGSRSSFAKITGAWPGRGSARAGVKRSLRVPVPECGRGR